MKTRSIWAGFALHSTVAVVMDLLALDRRRALPQAFPPLLPLLGLLWAGAATALFVLRRRRSRA
jgi:hypothetical protein